MTKDYRDESRGKHYYGMDYIPDKRLFAAVMFARRMMREGTPPGVANTRASDYYGVPVQDVAHYTGQAGARSRRRRRHH